MKPKKNPGADLKSRRGLFFEIGMLVALVAVIAAFAKSSEKNRDDGFPIITGTIYDIEQINRTVEKPKEKIMQVPKFKFTGTWKPLSNDTYIDPSNIYDGWDAEPDPVLPPVDYGVEDIGEEGVFIRTDIMPKFMGGDIETFRNWVYKRLKYPQAAQDNGIQGKVTITFVVEKDGSISNITVARTPDKLLSDEAVRIIADSPKWEPGRQRNNPVRIRYTLPVEFKITN